MRNIKPLHVSFEPGVRIENMFAVIMGVYDTLRLANVTDHIPVVFRGHRQTPNYKQGNALLAHQSLEWYIAMAQEKQDGKDFRPGFLNGNILAEQLAQAPDWGEHPRYELLIVRDRLYREQYKKDDAAIGMAHVQQGIAVVSVAQYMDRPLSIALPRLRMLTIHELGHLFGCASNTSSRPQESMNADKKAGYHCTNPNCELIINLSEEKEIDPMAPFRPLCDLCLKDLRAFFVDPPEIALAQAWDDAIEEIIEEE